MVPFYGQGMNCGFEDILVFDQIFSKHLDGKTVPTPDQLTNILKEYSEFRNPDAEAICDLAMNNYIEMRSSVTKPGYLIRKKIEGFLYRFMPKTVIPLYTMVSFSRIRYSEALERYHRQTGWFETAWTIVKVGIVGSLVGLGYWQRHKFFA